MVKKQITFTVAVMMLCFVNTQAQQNVCDGVLKYAGRNISSYNNERDKRSFIYQQVCKGNYSNSSGSVKAGLDAVIDNVPIKFNFGTDNRKQRVSTFCSENTELESEVQIAESFYSQVYSPAIDAWESCIKANTVNFRIEPTLIDDTAPMFKITNQLAGSGTVEIRAVKANNNSVACEIYSEGKPPVLYTFGTEMQKVILNKGDIANISCLRKSEKRIINSVETDVTPEVSISIFTSVNDYQIKLPTKKAFLVSENRMDEILNRILKLENRLSVQGSKNGCMRIDQTQICWGQAVLSDNNGAPHTKHFEAKFEKPFAEPPMITHGINAETNGKIFGIYTWNVQNDGFSGNLNNHTQKPDKIYRVEFNYIAVGKVVGQE